MITREARIAKLKQQAAEMLRQAEAIENDEAKRIADERRKADATAKLLLGAGVLLLDRPEQTRTVGAIMGKLSVRDRGRVQAWAHNRDLDLATLPTQEPVSPPRENDPEAAALKRVIGQFDVGGLSLLSTEFLSVAQREDRTILERMFASFNERRDSGTAGA